MAIGKSQRSDLVAYSFKIKTKDLPKPVFEIKKRAGDKWEPFGTDDTVSGNIIGIEPKSFKHEGKEIKSISVTLQDKGEIYFVTIPYTSLGRGLMNSLLNLKAFNAVEIGLYQTKPREGQTKTYPAVSLRQGGEIVKWKFEQKDIPAPVEVKFKGEIQRDFTAAEEFFSTHLVEFAKSIKRSAPVQPNENVSEGATKAAAPAAQEIDDDSVPF